MLDLSSPVKPEERYRKQVNFLWTTETGVYPLEVLPTIFDLDEQGVRYPNVLAITAAGQILDYIASLYNRIGRVDFVDFKSGQNIYVAYKLANVCRYSTSEEFKQHMFGKSFDDVVKGLDYVMMLFPEFLRYLETYDIDVEELAKFFVCKRDVSNEERFSQEFLTPYNLRHFFLEHEPWYRSLRDSVMSGVFHFSCGKIEDFYPSVEGGYDVVYLSDVHAWADRRRLASNLLNLVASGGWFQSAFFGADCIGFIEYARRDREFEQGVRELGEFETHRLFTERTNHVVNQVRRMLRLNYKQYTRFKERVLGDFPVKQQVPFVGQRRY